MSCQIIDLSESQEDRHHFDRFINELYVPGFPDPNERESPDNMLEYLRLRSVGWYGNNNYHILLMVEGDHVVAAAVCDYLEIPNTGIIEFLIVADHCKRKGYGRQLFLATENRLREDARRAGRPDLDAIAIEMNDPFRVAVVNDNHDPFERALIWSKWGFGRLEFPYVQPALSDEQSPVHCLLFGAKPLAAELQKEFPSTLVRDIVYGYLKWAMRIDRPEDNLTFQRMEEFLSRRTSIRLSALAEYVGHDPLRPFEVVPVSGPESAFFAPAMTVYQRAFPGGPTAVDVKAFEASYLWSESLRDRRVHYHLWSIRESSSDPVVGMASFFTICDIGFGGYIVIDSPLRGTNRSRLLLSRIEEQMIRDEGDVRGWYIECAPDSPEAAVFVRLGFVRVPISYHQPVLNADVGRQRSGSLGAVQWLLYKRLGADYEKHPPSERELKSDLAAILRHVYRVSSPTEAPVYQHALASLVNPME